MDTAGLVLGLLHFIAFALLGRFLLEATLAHRETVRFQNWLFLIAITLRFGASLALYEAGLVNVIKDEDASGWVIGQVMQESWESQGYTVASGPALFLDSYQYHHRGYYYLLGLLFMVTGAPGRLAAAALNCFLGAFTVVLVYRLARSLFSERVAVLAGWLACLTPSLIIWSAQTLKEPSVIFLETIALYGCTRLKVSGFHFRHITLVGLAAVLLVPFRFYAAYLVTGTTILSLVFPRGGRFASQASSLIAMIGVVVAALYLSGGSLLREVQDNSFDVQYLEKMRAAGAETSGSGVKVDADLETPVGIGTNLVIGGAHLLLAPFPWQWGIGLRTLLVVPEVLLWWVLLGYGVVPGLWHGIRKRLNDLLPLLIFLAGMGILYSLMFNNIGLIYRQRAQLLPWLLIFAAVGIEMHRTPTVQPAKRKVIKPDLPVDLASKR